MMKKQILYIPLFLMLLLAACVDDSKDIPKPFGYMRIDFPEKEYERFEDACPFSFEVPTSAVLVNNQNANGNPCFKSLMYPSLKAGVYFTYFPVDSNLTELIKTADDIVYEHHHMASGIQPKEFADYEKKVYGSTYLLMGDVAVNYVFFLTDSVNHFFAGKLYFESVPNYDSLQPCVEYIEQDMQHLVETFEWK